MTLTEYAKQPEDMLYNDQNGLPDWASHDSLFIECKNCKRTFGQPYMAGIGMKVEKICDKCYGRI